MSDNSANKGEEQSFTIQYVNPPYHLSLFLPF